MGNSLKQLTQETIDFINKQKMFFVATATHDSFINLSPKGMDSLRIIDENRVLWMNGTGSTNESSAHIQQDGRMTIMFCSFDKEPLVVKLLGRANVIHKNDKEWDGLVSKLSNMDGARQIFDLQIEIVLSVCGMGVPYFEYQGEREDLEKWYMSKGKKGIEEYWAKQNQYSLNNEPTHIVAKNIKPNK